MLSEKDLQQLDIIERCCAEDVDKLTLVCLVRSLDNELKLVTSELEEIKREIEKDKKEFDLNER